jgi:predicted nucleic acid-binding protein
MVYLFDTNAISDVMIGHVAVSARINRLASPDQTIICPIVRGEILFGVDRLPNGKKKDFLYITARATLAQFRCEPIDEGVADHYSMIKVVCRQNGVALNENDLWIAACSLSLSATLITRDGDFERVPGLRVEDWTK